MNFHQSHRSDEADAALHNPYFPARKQSRSSKASTEDMAALHNTQGAHSCPPVPCIPGPPTLCQALEGAELHHSYTLGTKGYFLLPELQKLRKHKIFLLSPIFSPWFFSYCFTRVICCLLRSAGSCSCFRVVTTAAWMPQAHRDLNHLLEPPWRESPGRRSCSGVPLPKKKQLQNNLLQTTHSTWAITFQGPAADGAVRSPSHSDGTAANSL